MYQKHGFTIVTRTKKHYLLWHIQNQDNTMVQVQKGWHYHDSMPKL